MRFSKWHALGNSYLLIEQADLGRPLAADQVRLLCDLRYGIGSDGVLEVLNVDDGVAEIAIWNPDGSLTEFSGNGTRIAAMWLSHRTGAEAVVVAVDGRRYAARRLEDGRIEMDVGAVEIGETITLELAEERVELTPAAVGNPHAVVRRRESQRTDLLRLGPLIESHERFPGRTNVQLVRVDDLHAVTALVWERGAGETSASGSSAVAVAGAAVVNGWCESPVTVRMPGGELEVSLDSENRATLTGPAEQICTGETTL
ncbi:MAG TPA: diaminopimelate epimerase [Gaiellaceae bacterium]|nr:diaminopimelate epimerase [Gaiellaceae bacterium]